MIVGFANGCFDLFHDGHRHFLIQCRTRCDYLVVAVNHDEYCRRIKGADRPHDPLATRMLHVRAIAEAVIPFGGREERLIMEIRPDIVFKGGDHGKTEDGVQVAWGARQPYWKYRESGEQCWFARCVHIPRLADFSTTLEAAKRGLPDARQPDAVPEAGPKP